MEETKLTSKGQVTIPKIIRERFGLRAGQKLVFISAENEIIVRPKMRGLRGLIRLREGLARSGKLLSGAEVAQMIAESKREWSKFN